MKSSTKRLLALGLLLFMGNKSFAALTPKEKRMREKLAQVLKKKVSKKERKEFRDLIKEVEKKREEINKDTKMPINKRRAAEKQLDDIFEESLKNKKVSKKDFTKIDVVVEDLKKDAAKDLKKPKATRTKKEVEDKLKEVKDRFDSYVTKATLEENLKNKLDTLKGKTIKGRQEAKDAIDTYAKAYEAVEEIIADVNPDGDANTEYAKANAISNAFSDLLKLKGDADDAIIDIKEKKEETDADKLEAKITQLKAMLNRDDIKFAEEDLKKQLGAIVNKEASDAIDAIGTAISDYNTQVDAAENNKDAKAGLEAAEKITSEEIDKAINKAKTAVKKATKTTETDDEGEEDDLGD